MQTANSKQQTANSKQQTANSKQQTNPICLARDKTQKFQFQNLFFKLLFILPFFISNDLKSQGPFGETSVGNCYQKVSSGTSGSAQNFNFINSSGGRSIKVNNTNPPDVDHISILYKDASNNINVLFGSLPIGQVYEVPIEYNNIIVKSYVNAAFVVIPDININFVDPIFTPKDDGKACLTFNCTSFNYELNLDGLCWPPDVKIKFPSTSITTCGYPLNWFVIANKFQGFTIPECPGLCEQQIIDPNTGLAISPCMTFDFEITLKACEDRTDCPNYVFTQQKQICCWCGTGPNNGE